MSSRCWSWKVRNSSWTSRRSSRSNEAPSFHRHKRIQTAHWPGPSDLFWLSSYVAGHCFAVVPQSGAKQIFYCTVTKLFSSLMFQTNKLECLSLRNLFGGSNILRGISEVLIFCLMKAKTTHKRFCLFALWFNSYDVEYFHSLICKYRNFVIPGPNFTKKLRP